MAYHIWKPRPLLRSILWKPVRDGPPEAADGAYEVFLEQRAFVAMHQHVWTAPPDDQPFGYLVGDLCEDSDSKDRYIVIRAAIRSPVPFREDEVAQIGREAGEALRSQVEALPGVLAGWYHRHRAGQARLSPKDESTHGRLFADPWQVAFLFVTDPGEPSGGCFRPPAEGSAGASPMPFYEMVSGDSLMAKGVKRSRIDWAGVRTNDSVIVESLPRPEPTISRPAAPRTAPAAAPRIAEKTLAATLPTEPAAADGDRELAEADVADAAPIAVMQAAGDWAPSAEAARQEEDRGEAAPPDEESAGAPGDVTPEEAELKPAGTIFVLETLEEETTRAAVELEAIRRTALVRKAAEEQAARRIADLESALSAAEEEITRQASELETARTEAETAEAARAATAEEATARVAELESALAAAREETRLKVLELEAAAAAAQDDALAATKAAESAETGRRALEAAARSAEEAAEARLVALQRTLTDAEEKAARRVAELEAAVASAKEEAVAAAKAVKESDAKRKRAEVGREAAEEAAAARIAELEAALKAAETEGGRRIAELETALKVAEEEVAWQAAELVAARKATDAAEADARAARESSVAPAEAAAAEEVPPATKKETGRRVAELEAALEAAEEQAAEWAAEAESAWNAAAEEERRRRAEVAARKTAEEEAGRLAAALEAVESAARADAERSASELQAALEAARSEASLRKEAEGRATRRVAESDDLQGAKPRPVERPPVPAEEVRAAVAAPPPPPQVQAAMPKAEVVAAKPEEPYWLRAPGQTRLQWLTVLGIEWLCVAAALASIAIVMYPVIRG